jgi:hypothetical protein
MQAGSRGEPRLRMGHLLLWVVGCAIGFAARRSLTPTNLATDRDRVMIFSSNIAWGMALGTNFTGCVLLAYRRWRGDTDYPSRAGHWLLLRGLTVDATWSASAHSRLSPSVSGSIVLMVDLAFLWGLRRLPRHWIAVFLVSSILAGIRAVGFMAFEFYHATSILMNLSLIGAGSVLLDALVILRAIGRDRRSGVPTDGLHRLGIVTVLALDALSVIFYLAWLVW